MPPKRRKRSDCSVLTAVSNPPYTTPNPTNNTPTYSCSTDNESKQNTQNTRKLPQSWMNSRKKTKKTQKMSSPPQTSNPNNTTKIFDSKCNPASPDQANTATYGTCKIDTERVSPITGKRSTPVPTPAQLSDSDSEGGLDDILAGMLTQTTPTKPLLPHRSASGSQLVSPTKSPECNTSLFRHASESSIIPGKTADAEGDTDLHTAQTPNIALLPTQIDTPIDSIAFVPTQIDTPIRVLNEATQTTSSEYEVLAAATQVGGDSVLAAATQLDCITADGVLEAATLVDTLGMELQNAPTQAIGDHDSLVPAEHEVVGDGVPVEESSTGLLSPRKRKHKPREAPEGSDSTRKRQRCT